MTTTDTDLDLRIRAFKASSSFTPGDAFSFEIRFAEDVGLPGKFDPSDYLVGLGVDMTGKNVLVVCPGNGGVCVEAVKAGASTVVALEPRVVYHRALPTISGLAADVIGSTFSQKPNADSLVESFDIVIWAEGLEEIPNPKGLLMKVLGAMKRGGHLYMEVGHGHQGELVESINSWKPSAEAFKASMSALGDLEFVSERDGRNQTRTIYTIKNNTVRVDVLPGPDFQSKEDVQEFAEKIKELDVLSAEAVERATAAETDEAKAAALYDAISAEAEKAEVLQKADLTPAPSDKVKELAEKVKSVMAPEAGGEMDSIYEGRASTPKSKNKNKTRARRPKRGKPKS